MKPTFFLSLSCVLFNILLSEGISQQTANRSGNSYTFFIPDVKTSGRLKEGKADPAKIFGISMLYDQVVINPQLESGWTSIAVKNLNFHEKNISFFLYDGWLYTNHSIQTAHRRMKFRQDVSHLIQANVFCIAFYSEGLIENQLVIFIASPEAVKAEILINEQLWGRPKKLTYALQAGQSHFMSIVKRSESSRPVYFSEDKAIRKTIDINNDWKFIKLDVKNAFQVNHSDSNWETISLPHCWNDTDVYDTRNFYDGFEIYHGYYRGSVWYRKHFALDLSEQNKSIYIHFEGVNQIARVWLNGIYLGEHKGGYTGFSFDITDQVRYGDKENVFAVQVDNSYNYDIPPHTADFIMYGGIYRDVYLLIKDKINIDDIFLSAANLSEQSAEFRIQTKIKNAERDRINVTLVSNVVDQDGEIVVSTKKVVAIKPGSLSEIIDTTSVINYPNLWTPNDPYLYNVYSTIYIDNQPVDQVKIPFGLRWYRFDENKGFFLNNHPLKLRGVNKHQDYFGLGNGVPDSLQIKDIRIIKEMGANFIRLAHYPHDPSVLKACDRLGLLVWSEIPLVNTVGGETFVQNTKEMMKEMILRDRNHPSVILWGITNESAMRFTNTEQLPKIRQLLQDLDIIAGELDPSRLTVQAHNHFLDISLAEITDVIGRNRYFGWYEGDYADFDKALDEERLSHPGWKTIISEYGVGSKRGHHVQNPEAFDFSEEYQLDFHEHYLKAINERPWIAGSAVWNAFDFGSFVKIGNIPRINQKGLCDMVRRPKDVYYFYQSQWTEEPMVYIVSHTRRFYNGLEGELQKIRIYSNCDEVELFLNDNSLGRKKKQYVFHWEIRFKAGINQLKAAAWKNDKMVEDEINVRYNIAEN